MVLKEDIHRFISTTELFLSDISGLRNTGFKKVNFFVGHPVSLLESVPVLVSVSVLVLVSVSLLLLVSVSVLSLVSVSVLVSV